MAERHLGTQSSSYCTGDRQNIRRTLVTTQNQCRQLTLEDIETRFTFQNPSHNKSSVLISDGYVCVWIEYIIMIKYDNIS